MAMQVTVEHVIRRSGDEVAAFTRDPDNDPTWIRNIREVEWKTDRPAQPGTEVARVAHFLGKRLAYTYVIDALEPGRRLGMRTTDGPFPMTTDYEWEDDADGTRMRIIVGGEPGGFFSLAVPLLKPQMRRALNQDLALLAELMEAEAR